MSFFDIFLGDDSKESIPGDTNSPEFAKAIMHKFQENHNPIIIKFKGSDHQYVSMILEVDDKKNIVVLDEFSPSDGHDKAIHGDVFRASTSDDGVTVNFKSHVVHHGKDSGIAFYHIKIPDNVEYVQRRYSFRLNLTSRDRYYCELKARDKLITNAYIKDISFTGIQIIVPEQNLEGILRPGDMLENFKIKISNDETAILDGVIKRVKLEPTTNSSSVALMYFKPEREVKKSISKFVCNLEREQLKRESEARGLDDD